MADFTFQSSLPPRLPEARRDGGRPIFLLAHTRTVPGAILVAQSRLQPTWADRVMVPLFDFYRAKISRRAPGNRREYFAEYRLYQFSTAAR